MLPCAHGVDCSCQQATAYRAHPEHPVVFPLMGHSGRAEGARRVDAASIQGDLHATGGRSCSTPWSPLMPPMIHVSQPFRPALRAACVNMPVLLSWIGDLYRCTLTLPCIGHSCKARAGAQACGGICPGASVYASMALSQHLLTVITFTCSCPYAAPDSQVWGQT